MSSRITIVAEMMYGKAKRGTSGKNMGKLLSLILVILSIPSISFGQTLTIVQHGTGNSSIFVGNEQQAHITVDVLISSPVPLDAIQFSIYAVGYEAFPPPIQDYQNEAWIYDNDNPWTNGTLYDSADYLTGVGLIGGGGSLASVYNTPMAEGYYNFESPRPPMSNELVATYKLEWRPFMFYDGDYHLFAGNDPLQGPFLNNGYLAHDGTGFEPWIETIPLRAFGVPEPTTLLLLALGSLAVIKRKRLTAN
ncbi:MAG: PEP-CTERM sorting domain-containing protein [Planctomycetota bacterium]|jgi:hypothetical protein